VELRDYKVLAQVMDAVKFGVWPAVVAVGGMWYLQTCLKEGLNMAGVGPWEILIILLAIAIIFGAGRIPEIGANLGKGIRNFKKSFSEIDSDDAEKKKLEDGEGKS
jgi:sec-independent protein translocase protein TatA